MAWQSGRHVIMALVMSAIFFPPTFPLSVENATSHPDFTYTKNITQASLAGVSIIDTRNQESCIKQSIVNARCLPAATFLGPHGRLVNMSAVLWILGTAGLDGSEPVLVVGGTTEDRDFIAGLIFLAGQFRVTVLNVPLNHAIKNKKNILAPGMAKSNTREKVYQAQVRDNLIVLRGDIVGWLSHGNAPVILDGRSEKEYWGEMVRGSRGGHIPGADLLEKVKLRKNLTNGTALLPLSGSPVAYARNALEGISYFTLLRAGGGVNARVYLGGWSDWAAHSELPADSVTYPDQVIRKEKN